MSHVVKGITTMDLICHRCDCGQISIDGFFHQLKIASKDLEKMTVTMECPCSVCGLMFHRTFSIRERETSPSYTERLEQGDCEE